MIRRAFATLFLLFDAFARPAKYRRSVCAGRSNVASAHEPARQLLVDISVLVRTDAGTGIQRATKELLRELTAAPPVGYEVRTVRASRWHPYRYAEDAQSVSKVHVKSGDIFLGLDLASRILPRHRLQLVTWQMVGARICIVMHDLLPLHHPEWFTGRNARAYRAWIHTVAVHADAVVCVSRTVAEQFRTWLACLPFASEFPPHVGWFHHGVRPPPHPGLAHTNPTVANIALGPFVLMVGTIEPRKGYATALDAFDALWRDGESMPLVIVGRIGWKVESLVARLRTHSELGKRLHWYENANDDALHALYQAASGVLVASEAEGFGLTILEAAAHKRPLLLRDLPVFREIAGNGATYFSAVTPQQVRQEFAAWIQALNAGTAITSTTIPCHCWAESARRLVTHLAPP